MLVFVYEKRVAKCVFFRTRILFVCNNRAFIRDITTAETIGPASLRFERIYVSYIYERRLGNYFILITKILMK
jgi:hypothetical protein